MAVAEISPELVTRVIAWGTRHPKFVFQDKTAPADDPLHWAKETLTVNKRGALLVRVDGDEEVQDYFGTVSLERRSEYAAFRILDIFVVHTEPRSEGIPWVLNYQVHESLNRRRHFLRERHRIDATTGFHLAENPNPEAFAAHVAFLQSIEDFDWTEAEETAAQFCEIPPSSE